jgi:hypothetical protein
VNKDARSVSSTTISITGLGLTGSLSVITLGAAIGGNVPGQTFTTSSINNGVSFTDNRGFPGLGVKIYKIATSTSQITTGILDISSIPLGAEITIDNQDQSKVTRSVIQNIPTGSHSLKLTLAGYRDYTTTFTISASRTTTLTPTLIPVTSTPGCQIPQNVKDASTLVNNWIQSN